MERIEPALPIDAIEPADAIDMIEPADENESIEPTLAGERSENSDTLTVCQPWSRYRQPAESSMTSRRRGP